MASSRVMATTSSANSDLARQPSPLLYPLSPVVPVAGGGDPQITARALGAGGSMNIEDILHTFYIANSVADVASTTPVGEIASYCGGAAKTEYEEDEERLAADEMWGGIPGGDENIGSGVNGVGGASSVVYPVPTEMTLEDFLVRAGIGVGAEVVTDEDVRVPQGMVPPPQPPMEGSMLGLVVDTVLADRFAQPLPQQPQQGVSVEGAFVGFSNGVEGGGGGRNKRRAVLEPEDKIQQQRQRRMIKNRESAARSRERKQAYTVELEKTVTQLEEENMRLRAQQEEARKNRLKQLLEALVPVTEKRATTSSNGLRRTLSI